jgi:hypothetical protein
MQILQYLQDLDLIVGSEKHKPTAFYICKVEFRSSGMKAGYPDPVGIFLNIKDAIYQHVDQCWTTNSQR